MFTVNTIQVNQLLTTIYEQSSSVYSVDDLGKENIIVR